MFYFPTPPRVPNPFSLADIKKLENHLVKAGFSDVHIETVNVTFELHLGKIIVNTVKQLVLRSYSIIQRD